jgi:DNA replication and repair protein RecF
MILSELTLKDFRSFNKFSITFSPEVTLISGVNGAGKTNIIEAIFTLATGKSFRAGVEREMIGWGKEIARIKGKIEDTKLELLFTTGLVGGKPVPTKKYLVNGVSRRALDFVGNLKAVLFWPEDLELVIGSPSLRRHYLDRVLVQTDREYRRNLLSYEKGLRQRNRLLDVINEGRAARSQLFFWNQLLIKAGGYITDTRASFIEYVNNYLVPGLNYQIIYDKSIISESRLEQYAVEEVAAKSTLVGPHRDDFEFEKAVGEKLLANSQIINKQHNHDYVSLSAYGSRGEQRLGILWLKLAELSYIQTKTNDRPILILDDIFSELDEKHRELVIELIKKYQTIISSAEDETGEMLRTNKIPFTLISLGKDK